MVLRLIEECKMCHGLGKVFYCKNWISSDKECCPIGSTRLDCPGEEETCKLCDGKGMLSDGQHYTARG